MNGENITSRQAGYYGRLYDEHGDNVDSVASAKQIYKDLRYEKLAEVFAGDSNFSIYDIGFGLGHFREFLTTRFPDKTIQFRRKTNIYFLQIFKI